MRPDSFEVRRDELRQLFRRSREVVLLAALTGIVTGLAVRGFEYLVEEAFHAVLHAPLWMTALAPAVGLASCCRPRSSGWWAVVRRRRRPTNTFEPSTIRPSGSVLATCGRG